MELNQCLVEENGKGYKEVIVKLSTDVRLAIIIDNQIESLNNLFKFKLLLLDKSAHHKYKKMTKSHHHPQSTTVAIELEN